MPSVIPLRWSPPSENKQLPHKSIKGILDDNQYNRKKMCSDKQPVLQNIILAIFVVSNITFVENKGKCYKHPCTYATFLMLSKYLFTM